MSFNRKLQESYTIPSSSQSTTLPMNSYIAVAAGPISASPEVYNAPETFDGLRFHRLRSESGADSHSHQFVNTGLDSMTFGHGRYACPGRFFASNESKVILATLLLKYDIKFGNEGEESGRSGASAEKRPENQVFADACFPNPSVKVLFRRRQG